MARRTARRPSRRAGVSRKRSDGPIADGASPPSAPRHDSTNIAPPHGRVTSPRVRGSRVIVTMVIVGIGVIPACAGKPWGVRWGSRRFTRHPRVYGEALFCTASAAVLMASSPRVREGLSWVTQRRCRPLYSRIHESADRTPSPAAPHRRALNRSEQFLTANGTGPGGAGVAQGRRRGTARNRWLHAVHVAGLRGRSVAVAWVPWVDGGLLITTSGTPTSSGTARARSRTRTP